MSNPSFNTIEFQGQSYFDDRLYVSYLCKGTVDIQPDGVVITRIYHEKEPTEYVWCAVTYRNCIRYPLFRVISFYKKDDAMAYIRKIEPETPLVSLDGKSPDRVVSYEDYLLWKRQNKFKEYDWQSLYTPGGTNASECVYQTKEQFKGIL